MKGTAGATVTTGEDIVGDTFNQGRVTFQIKRMWPVTKLKRTGVTVKYGIVAQRLGHHFALFLGRCRQNPQDQKQSHHRHGEIGKGHFPGTTTALVVTAPATPPTLDDNRRLITHQAASRSTSASMSTSSMASSSHFSSVAKPGLMSSSSTRRPASTANNGDLPSRLAISTAFMASSMVMSRCTRSWSAEAAGSITQ